MENGIFNRRNVISICVVAAVIVILTIVFLSRSNTGDEHIDDIQRDSTGDVPADSRGITAE